MSQLGFYFNVMYKLKNEYTSDKNEHDETF